MMSDTVMKWGAAVLIAAALAIGGYTKGKSDARVEVLKDTIEAIEKRKDIDNAVKDMPAYDQCLALGGVPDECEELRGMDEAPGSQ